MKALGAVEVQLHPFLPIALDEGKYSASRPARFAPGTIAYELSVTVVLHVIVYASMHNLDHSDPVLKRWVKQGIHTYRFIQEGRGNSKLRIFINEISVGEIKASHSGVHQVSKNPEATSEF
jgi:hypothetical protein